MVVDAEGKIASVLAADAPAATANTWESGIGMAWWSSRLPVWVGDSQAEPGRAGKKNKEKRNEEEELEELCLFHRKRTRAGQAKLFRSKRK